MPATSSEARLEAIVEQVRSALEASASEDPTATPDRAALDASLSELVGEAADGLVRAVVGPDGRLRLLTIAPELMRRPLADVGVDVRTAINAALGARPGAVDASPLIDVLRSVRDQAMQEMGVVTSGLQDVDGAIRATRSAQREGGVR